MENGAAKALAEWGKALGAAQAKLGKKGKLPKTMEDPKTAITKSAALAKTVQEQSQQLEATLKAYQTALTDVEGACDTYRSQIEKDEFGLNKGNTDEERLINAARYILSKQLGEIGLGSQSPRKQAAKVIDALTAADLGTF